MKILSTSNPIEIENSQMMIDIETSEENKCILNSSELDKCRVVLLGKDNDLIPTKIAEIKDEESTSEGLVNQSLVVEIPNNALRGGMAYIYKNNGLESNIFLNGTYACNMLSQEDKFLTASVGSLNRFSSCFRR